ncbi:MAG TPA: NADP-dependent phosphogluconate dehydrogenase, partial [Bacteroidia bacterium]|nr:NADP-dependent phosphogluconate dehydrogenase [Bacteroidia bacterium]
SGARYGPSIMPGGPKQEYKRVAAMLEAISAKVDKNPCVKWLGPSSAGHYVKMVHNGIEYGLMQLISESYHLLKLAGRMNNDDLHKIFAKWNDGMLHSFLIEITADIFAQKDEITSNSLIDMILDRAHQKGTGGWTSEDAMNLQVPISVIDSAVSTRDLSVYKKEREEGEQKLKGPGNTSIYDTDELARWVEHALYFSMITTYTQGFALLHVASKEYKYNLKLEDIASIWKGGCIIRAGLLEDIHTAFSEKPELSNAIMNDGIAQKLMQSQIEIRKIVQIGVEAGIPIPAMMSSLAYYDGYRRAWLPANLIQAQRDYFGAHTYERTDREGSFHTEWGQKKKQNGTKG